MEQDIGRDAEGTVEAPPEVEPTPVQESVETSPSEKPKTLREALELAHRDITKNISRDEKGRFAPKSLPAWAQSQAERDAEKISPDQESEEAQGLEQPATLEPPLQWSADAKEAFRKLPAEAQRFMLDRHSQMEGDYTRKTQEVARLQKQYSELDQVMSRYDEKLTQLGYTPGRLVDQFMRVQDWLERDPARCLSWLANSYGLTFGQLAQLEQSAQSNVDPALHQLQQELYEIKSRLQQSDVETQQTTISNIESDIVSWSAEKDPNGSALRPHFEAVRDEMIPLVQFLREKAPDAPHREILQEAYERAVWANPTTRVAVQNAKKLDAAKAAKQAAVSVSGAPGGGVTGAPPKKDTRSIMEWAWNQAVRV